MRCFEIIKNKVVVKTESVSLQPNEVNSHHLTNLFLSPLINFKKLR